MDMTGRRAALSLAERRSLESRAARGDGKAHAELEALDFGQAIARTRARTSLLNAQISACAAAINSDRDELEQLRLAEWLPGSEARTRNRFAGSMADYEKVRPPTDAELLAAAARFLRALGVVRQAAPVKGAPDKAIALDPRAVYSFRNARHYGLATPAAIEASAPITFADLAKRTYIQ